MTSALTALTAVLAVLISWLTFKMNRDGQISARYTSAVEQLGNGKPIAQVGALYTLGRIAAESDYDRPVIIGMLSDYVKQSIGMGSVDPAAECHARKAPSLDVVVALRVLFYRIERRPDDDRIDLRWACLSHVDLPGADLTCVRLDQSVIEYSTFDNATFVDVSMQHTRIAGNAEPVERSRLTATASPRCYAEASQSRRSPSRPHIGPPTRHAMLRARYDRSAEHMSVMSPSQAD